MSSCTHNNVRIGSGFRFIACSTLFMFLMTSCGTYNAAIYNDKGAGYPETTSKNYIHNLTLCIVPSTEDNRLRIDSGINDVVIDCNISNNIQYKIKDEFKKTVIVSDDKAKYACDVHLYVKQAMTSEGDRMVYQFNMKAEDAKTGKMFYAEKTSSQRNYDKSSGAFMFFSTLLFPPVLGGFFYALRTHSIAADNFEAAKAMINYAVDENIAKFEKAAIPSHL
jgi:hypothetical protein